MIDFKLLSRKKKAAKEAATKQKAYYNNAELHIYELGFISGTNWKDTESTSINIFLNAQQIEVLEKIARRSKMDAWFSLNNNIGKKEDIRTLFEGATAHDLETVTSEEMVTIIDLIFKIV